MDNCSGCRYWQLDALAPRQALVYGECRRYPPARQTNRDAAIAMEVAAWPLTEEDDWCGEFVSRKTTGEPRGAR